MGVSFPKTRVQRERVAVDDVIGTQLISSTKKPPLASLVLRVQARSDSGACPGE
jgi:hypothetical protein